MLVRTGIGLATNPDAVDGDIRHAERMGDLFTGASAADEYRDLAWVGYYDGEAGLAKGFAEAAEAIFSTWQIDTRSKDHLLPPLVYNYRHALELALKQAIRQASGCLQVCECRYDVAPTPQDLGADFKRRQRHRLGPLAQQLAELLAGLNLDWLPPDIMRLLQSLHQLDPTGEAFRYEGALKTSAHHVNVAGLVERLRAAFRVIHGGILTGLTEHADILREIREECAGP
jgi:hypothetical protein